MDSGEEQKEEGRQRLPFVRCDFSISDGKKNINRNNLERSDLFEMIGGKSLAVDNRIFFFFLSVD